MSEQSSPTIYQIVQSSENHSEQSITQEITKNQIQDKISAIYKKISQRLDKKEKLKIKSKSTAQNQQGDHNFLKNESTNIFLNSLLQKLTLMQTEFQSIQIQQSRLAQKLNATISNFLYLQSHNQSNENLNQRKKHQHSAEPLNIRFKNILKTLYQLPLMKNYSQKSAQLDKCSFFKKQLKNSLNFQDSGWQNQIVLQRFINQNEQLRTNNQKLKSRVEQLQHKSLQYFDRIHRIGQRSPYFSRVSEQQQPYLERQQNFALNAKETKLPQTNTSLKLKQYQYEAQIQRITQSYQVKIYQLQKKLKVKSNSMKEMDQHFKSQIQKYNSVFQRLQLEIVFLKKELNQDKIYKDHHFQQFQCKSYVSEKGKMEDIINQLNWQINRLNMQRQNDLKIITDLQRNQWTSCQFNNYNHHHNQYQHHQQSIPYQNKRYCQREYMFPQRRSNQTFMRQSQIKNNSSSRVKQKDPSGQNYFFSQKPQVYERVPKYFRSHSPIERNNSIIKLKPSVKDNWNSHVNQKNRQQHNQRSESRHEQRLQQMKRSLYHNRNREDA